MGALLSMSGPATGQVLLDNLRAMHLVCFEICTQADSATPVAGFGLARWCQ